MSHERALNKAECPVRLLSKLRKARKLHKGPTSPRVKAGVNVYNFDERMTRNYPGHEKEKKHYDSELSTCVLSKSGSSKLQ